MKLIHGSLHRVIELPAPFEWEVKFMSLQLWLLLCCQELLSAESPHHEESLLSYFPGSHGVRVSHLESEFCWKCLCGSLTSLRGGWGPRAPGLGDQLLTVGSGAGWQHIQVPLLSGSALWPAQRCGGEWLCSFHQDGREPLQGVPRALPVLDAFYLPLECF